MRKCIIISSTTIAVLLACIVIIRRPTTTPGQQGIVFQFAKLNQKDATVSLKFNHTSGESIWAYGFHEPKDGVFFPRFCQYEALRTFGWKKRGECYCATGAMVFELKCNADYTIKIPIGMFKSNETIRVGIRAFRKPPQFLSNSIGGNLDPNPSVNLESSEIFWSDPVDIEPASAT